LAICAALLLAVMLWPATAGAAYQKIRVQVPLGPEAKAVFFHPDLELMSNDDGALILLSRPELTEGLIERGFPVEVMIDDLEAHYAAQCRGQRDYGVWHTYTEMVDEINLLHAQFPNLTTAPFSIGTTGQGRTIWCIKVSDNPDVQEDEPEVLFDGMIHAREIMTVEGILHFIRYLCENYTTDPAMKFLVDNRQVYFVPILNVDGFVYNEQTNPNGGGMWRKNRRANTGGCYGVDNNRNFPFEWVGSGSSPDPCSETYRGPSAGSEPENQAIMNLINSHHFITWQSYHSVAGLVLFPWGYTSAHTEDDALFRQIGAVMAAASGYAVGQAPELLYSVNGGSFDWGYGATNEHPKIMSFTTEFGGSDFWPNPSERDGLIAENLYSNIYLCQIAGAYLELQSIAVTGGDGNGRLDPGESAALVVTVRNPGVLMGASDVQASITSSDPYVAFSDAQANIGLIAPGGTGSNGADPFELTVDASCPAGRMATFTVVMTAAGGLRIEGTASLRIGQPTILYANDFENTGEEWSSDPTHTASTGAFVRVDPVAAPFQPGDDTTPAPGVYAWITAQNPNGREGIDDVDSGIAASRSGVINLAGASHADLDLNFFCGQRDQGDDPSGDFLRIDLSNNGGATFPANLLLIGDVAMPGTWQNLQVALEDYLPLTGQMVLRVQAADAAGANDIVEAGLDDIYIYAGSGNEAPSAPTLSSPPDGAPDQPANLTLVVHNAVDPDGDALTYSFRIYSDEWMTTVVRSADGIPAGSGTTSWTVDPPLPQGTFYWRAFASDPYERGMFMARASFGVSDPTGLGDPAVASTLTLSAGPSPASGSVLIRFYTPSSPTSTLHIFDSAGRQVRSLNGPRWSEGWQELLWDGRDDHGSRVASGVYFVRLVVGQESRAVRVIQVD